MKDREWYLNEDFVSKLKEDFEKAGLPLEYRAKKIIEEKGFEVSEYHYKFPNDHVFDETVDQKEGIWRQIDIRATPNIYSTVPIDFKLNIGSFRLTISPEIIGECKFSSNKTFFLFKSDRQYINNFPSSIWGNNLLPSKLSLNYPDDESLFRECAHNWGTGAKFFNLDVYENVVEVDLEHLGQKNDKNFNDQTTYRACEQLYNAVNYHLSTAKPELSSDTFIEISESTLFEKWLLYLKDNNITKEDAMPFGNRILDSIAIKFLQENFDLTYINNILHYIECVFPILIINEDAGLFEVILDERSNIKKFEKIKYGLYKYNARECYSHDRCLYPDCIGIIICDICFLNELINSIIEGIRKLGHHLKKNLDKWPYLLGYELLFNPELIDPNDYFSD